MKASIPHIPSSLSDVTTKTSTSNNYKNTQAVTLTNMPETKENKLATEIQPKMYHVKADQTESRKLLYVGSNGKLICKNMVELNYVGLSLNNSFKAFCWLQKMAMSYAWSEKMGLSGDDLPDAIICDLELADGTAYSLFERLKRDEYLQRIPFIIVAKNYTKAEKLKALERGIDDIYPTTVNPNDLDNRISFLKKFKKELKKVNTEPQALEKEQTDLKMPLIKRLFDIAVSGTLLILLSPLLVAIAILVKLESRGPIFYVSKRAGTGYQVFNFFKFRSMRTGADKELSKLMHLNQYQEDDLDLEDDDCVCLDCMVMDTSCSPKLTIKGKEICENQYDRVKKLRGSSSFIKIENDPRITRIGKFIRNTSIDELPQLFNVLIGDMSIVGNRPLPLYEAEQLTTDQWAKRFLAPSGITGLWQVTKRGKGGDMSEAERKQLDIDYAEKPSFWRDLKILFMTIPALLQKGSV